MSKKKKTMEEQLKEVLVPEDEQPYQVPENWNWTKIKGIGSVKGGKRLPKGHVLLNEPSPYPYLRVTDFKNGTIDDTELKYISEDTASQISRYVISKDDVYISIAGTIGKAGIIPNHLNGANLTENAAKITDINGTSNQFIYLALNTDELKNQIKNSIVSTSQPKLALFRIEELKIPLPPIMEQKRIVEKVELLLNKIEEAKQLIEEAKETFELRRAAILDKACRGELTRNWRDCNPEIESAVYLYERIKNKNIDTELKINTSNIKPIPIDGEPFELPLGWKWVKLGELAYYVTSGSRGWSKYYSEKGALFIRTQDIKYNKLIFNEPAFMDLPENIEGKRSRVEKFDLLTSITGYVGKTALVNYDIPEAYVSQSVALTKLKDKSIAPYIQLCLESPNGGGGELKKRAYGIGRPVLNLEDIKNVKIPLAPLEEQEEILKIVEKILSNEDRTLTLLKLDNKINHIKKTILSKAFHGELGTNDPSEENAIELLKKVLREQLK